MLSIYNIRLILIYIYIYIYFFFGLKYIRVVHCLIVNLRVEWNICDDVDFDGFVVIQEGGYMDPYQGVLYSSKLCNP